MIVGAHSIIYSTDPEADRTFIRDVLNFPFIDVGDGWLIFGLPPSEVAIHPSDHNNVHEFYLMCDDIQELIDEMQKHHITCGEVYEADWGLLSHLKLPGGGRLGVYQARHARPESMRPKNKA